MNINCAPKFKITSEILEHFKLYEGYANHLYLDGAGLVTIGIGCVLANWDQFNKLNPVRFKDNLLAPVDEVSGEFYRIKAALPGKILKIYAGVCNLYVPEVRLSNLFEFRLNEKFEGLCKQIANFEKYPSNVQLVVLDMAFNVGIAGLLIKFPKFIDHIRNKNLVGAANESTRIGVSPARNQWAMETLLKTL